jgi:hypothetical protein
MNIRRLIIPLLSMAAALSVAVLNRQAPAANPRSQGGTYRTAPSLPPATSRDAPASPGAGVVHPEIGFRTPEKFAEHYAKHGAEFGQVSKADYLHRAQVLRDAPVGGDVLEARRSDGVISRYDQRTGAFLAFDGDLVIRTFFRPNDGGAYFQRQIGRRH